MSFIEASGVELGKVSVTYHQSPDSCSDDEDYQMLTIETDNAGAGKFYVISTLRWAFSNIEELIAILEDFRKRSGIDIDEMLNKSKKETK